MSVKLLHFNFDGINTGGTCVDSPNDFNEVNTIHRKGIIMLKAPMIRTI
jgi:hypothetical protein